MLNVLLSTYVLHYCRIFLTTMLIYSQDAGIALRGFGKAVIESWNFLATLNEKYDLTGKATETIKSAINKAAAENESFDQVTKTFDSTVSKVSEINKEFDLVTKAKQALVAAGTLSDAALEKVEELNAKVSFDYFKNNHGFNNQILAKWTW